MKITRLPFRLHAVLPLCTFSCESKLLLCSLVITLHLDMDLSVSEQGSLVCMARAGETEIMHVSDAYVLFLK